MTSADRGRLWMYLDAAAPFPTATLIMTGEFANDQLGTSLACAGDVNGDGADDILGGAPLSDASAAITSSGEVYLLFGCATMSCVPDLFVDAVFSAQDSGMGMLEDDEFGHSVH